MCPFGRRLINGDGGWFEKGEACCHCLLVETAGGLVLIDTGMGTQDLTTKGSQLPLDFRLMMNVRLNLADTALHQIKALGFDERDVTDIVLTHLDLDHAGGIPDFPNARVHVFMDEYDAAINPKSLKDKRRYLKSCWDHTPNWQLHKVDGESWQGFESVIAINDAETDILLVPTVGHTRGHCAVAVKKDHGWLMHCGDAYFYHKEMDKHPTCTPGFKIFQNIMAINHQLMEQTKDNLRALNTRSGSEIEMFCAHDIYDLRKFN